MKLVDIRKQLKMYLIYVIMLYLLYQKPEEKPCGNLVNHSKEKLGLLDKKV
jgi:hypothetical protein